MSPEGAAQCWNARRWELSRPFRALGLWGHVPRAMPWATMGQAFGLWVGVWVSCPQGDALGLLGHVPRVMRWAFGGHVPRAMPWATMGKAFGLWGFYAQGDALGCDG